MALLAIVSLTYICYAYATLLPPKLHYELREVSLDDLSLGVPRSVQKSWAMYSPYFAAERYAQPPKDCKVDQVSSCSSQHHVCVPAGGSDNASSMCITA